MPDLEILYEEPHFLLVNKPSGLFSQSPPGIPNLQDALCEQLADRQRQSNSDSQLGKPFVGLPHRLDRGTSGIMLIARNQRALKRFGGQFQSRKVSKFYLAVVQGELPAGPMYFEDWIRKIPDKPLSEITSEGMPDSRLASMSCARIALADGWSLALIELHTGRMHQIRIQFSSRGFPVLGDWSYGSQLTFGPLDPEGFRQCLALHALRMEFRHPQTAKLITGTAAVPVLWQTLPSDIQSACERARRISLDDFERPWPSPGTPDLVI